MDDHEFALQVMDDDGAGSAITSVPVQVSYDEDSDWCQEHGHTGLLAGSVCPICDALDETSRIAREREAIREVLARRYGPAIPVTEDMIDAVAHEAAFAALPEDEQASRYASFEQGTAGSWLGTQCS